MFTVLNCRPRTQKTGKTCIASEGYYDRDSLPWPLGDAIFSLEVGETVLVKYVPNRNPYGWHIIKRLR